MVKKRCGWEERFELRSVCDYVQGTFQKLRARQGHLIKSRTVTMIIAEPLEGHFDHFVILLFRSSAMFFGNSDTEMFFRPCFQQTSLEAASLILATFLVLKKLRY